jgi:hypothetical protein
VSFSKFQYNSHPAATMNGTKKGNMRAIYCAFDEDTFNTIRKQAEKNNVSFAEQVRTVVEWGLESCKHVED